MTDKPGREELLVYPGSFDPITFGHLDLLHRAARLFDKIVIAIAAGGNAASKKPLFSLEERKSMIEEVLRTEKLNDKVSVEGFDNLLVDFMRTKKARFLLRGLRSVTDFEFEFQLANINRSMYPEIETVFLIPDEGFAYISSSLVREVASLKGDVSKFVPKSVVPVIAKKFS